jgi:hypothetical protein
MLEGYNCNSYWAETVGENSIIAGLVVQYCLHAYGALLKQIRLKMSMRY